MIITDSDIENPSSFETDVSEVLTRLRTTLAEVISAIPEEIAKGADLHRALRIDRKLSWKVFRVTSSADPVAAGVHVPTRTNLNTFLRAARKRGVPHALIDSASRVAGDFEKVVAAHAGDRATFDSMVSALAADDESMEQLDLVHRRLAFRGQRHILGAYAKTQLKLVAMQPSENPLMTDGLRVEGLIGLRRLRCDAPLVVSYAGARNDDGSPMMMKRQPLDPEGGADGMALLREFCSQPLPEFRAAMDGMGFIKGELLAHDVGNRAAVTCIEGHITPAVLPRYREEGNRVSGTVVPVRTPCEALIVDLLFHKDTYGPIKPTVHAYPELRGEINWSIGLQHYRRSPGDICVNYLGRGPSVMHSPDVPRYAELGAYVFERAGWPGEDFDVYRCRIEYPVLPSSVVITFDLPEQPQD